MRRDSSCVLFAGSSHVELAQELARTLGIELGSLSIESFPDGEISVHLLEEVRGRDVFLLQTIARRPNHYLMELLLLVDACRRGLARSITALIPYYGYARQDRQEEAEGGSIAARLVADLLERTGVTRVVTMDLHAEQIQGFFRVSLENLCARPLFVQAVKKARMDNLVVVSPDMGRSRHAREFAEEIGAGFALVDKRRIDARNVKAEALVGDVAGKNILLVDDICSTGSTLKVAAAACRDAGAVSVSAFISHGLFVGGMLKETDVDRVYVTNSVPYIEREEYSHVIVLSVAELFAQVIKGDRSIS